MAKQDLLMTGGTRTIKLHGRHVEIIRPYQLMLNVDGISIDTKTYVTTDNNRIGQIYLRREELKVQIIGHNWLMKQDAVHIGKEADVTAHLLDTDGKTIGVIRLLDTGAVVTVMPIKTWERLGSRQSRSHLRSRENSNKSPPNGRTEPLHELSRGGEPG